jgi:cob(I)alamin adenosyltransferase
MVNLNRIYTRTGDAGATRLSDMSWARKTDARVRAYGDVDEANSVIGLALAMGGLSDEVADLLRLVQNELFDLGADLSNPLSENPPYPPRRIEQASIDRLEAWCDEFTERLPNLSSFILPGGSPAAAHLHQARTVTRRAERSAWAAVEAYGNDPSTSEEVPGGINQLALTYLNRLSDLLFILTRVVNGEAGDILWVPGGDRRPQDPRATRRRERITSRPNALDVTHEAGGDRP